MDRKTFIALTFEKSSSSTGRLPRLFSLISAVLVVNGALGVTRLESLRERFKVPPILQCTPLEELLYRNGDLPGNDKDWYELFSGIDGSGPDIYFSEGNARTSLLDPRRIFLARSNGKETVTGGSFFGRLMAAVGRNDRGKRVAEIITAPARGYVPLFVTVDRTARHPVRVEPLNKCRQCHMTEGFEYTIYPWTNSSANIVHVVALLHRLKEKNERRYGPVLAEMNRIIEGAKHVKRKRQFIEREIAKSSLLQEVTHQGVPIFRNQSNTTGDDQYGGNSGAFILHSVVEDMGKPLSYAQGLELLPKKERSKFLSDGLRLVLENNFAIAPSDSLYPVPKSLEGRRVPAFRSSLTLDSDAVTNTVFPQVTSIDMVDKFYSILVDNPRRLEDVIAYDRAREAARGKHPGSSNFSPRNYFQYDTRGRPNRDGYPGMSSEDKFGVRVRVIDNPYLGQSGQMARQQMNPFGLTVADFDYFRDLIESRGASLEDAIEHVMKSRWVTRLLDRGTIPSRPELKVALINGLSEYFFEVYDDSSLWTIPSSDYLSEYDRECLTQLRRPAPPGHSCVRCHGSESPIVDIVSTPGQWAHRLEYDPEAKELAGLMKIYLDSHKMPPPESPEAFQFDDGEERKKLMELLRK